MRTEWCRVFPGLAGEVAEARHFVASLAEGHASVDDAVLVVSELATNAVRHSLSGADGGWFLVVLGFGDDLVRIEVIDQGGEREPRLCDVTEQEEGGRGLVLVAGCAKDWGVGNWADRRPAPPCGGRSGGAATPRPESPGARSPCRHAVSMRSGGSTRIRAGTGSPPATTGRNTGSSFPRPSASRSTPPMSAAPSVRRSRTSRGSMLPNGRLGSSGTASCHCSPTVASPWRRSPGSSVTRERP